jgi:flagellar biosynthesis regulator FlaF
MPLWLRKFTYNKILEVHQNQTNAKENNVVEKSIAALKASGNTKSINLHLILQRHQKNDAF